MKTLDPGLKAVFSSAGYSLTPAEEHVAANAAGVGFDWRAAAIALGELFLKAIPFLLALLAGQTPPMQTVAAGRCDHHKCCCECLHQALKTVECIEKHCCECCCE